MKLELGAQALEALSGMREELFEHTQRFAKGLGIRNKHAYRCACERFIAVAYRDGTELSEAALDRWLNCFRLHECPHSNCNGRIEENKLGYQCTSCGEVVS